jgi:hypothetical protein
MFRNLTETSTVEFLLFGLDWTHVAEIRFSENKGLPIDNDPPRWQKVRNSTVELGAKVSAKFPLLVMRPK